MKKRWKSCIALAIFVGSLFYYGHQIELQRKVNRDAPPLAGEIVVYTDIPSAVSTMLAKKYQDTYHVKVKVLPLTETQLAERLQKKKTLEDGDIVITSTENLHIGYNNKMFNSVVLPITDLVSTKFKNEEGCWVGLWYDPIVFVEYEKQAITTWSGLIQPGPWTCIIPDFAATRTAGNILYSFVEVYGEDKAMNFFQELKPHVKQYSKYVGTAVRLVVLGEADIGIGTYSDACEYKARNYPIKIIYPQDGTPYMLTGVAMLKNSEHKMASRNFVAWLLSKDVAELLQSQGLTYMYTNPEIKKAKDDLGEEIKLFNIVGNYTSEGKENLLKAWINKVRFD